MKKQIYREILAIIIGSFLIAIIYNFISDKGLPLIRREADIVWESDSVINKYIKTNTFAVDSKNVTKPSSEKILSSVKDTSAKKDKQNLSVGVIIKTEMKNEKPIDTAKIEPKAIPQTEPEKPITPTAITVDQAYKLYQNNAVFLDSRMEIEYSLGHIKGSINIPYKRFEHHSQKLSGISKDVVIVCYCDGTGCDTSIELAKKLTALGYRNVKIFYSGWNDWKERNYPME